MNLKKIMSTIFTVLLTLSWAVGVNAADRYNMSYVYFGNTNSYYQYVENTQNSLNEISPNYFNIKSDGNLDLTSAIDTGFIAEMHKKGIKVVPFISNHWDRTKGVKALQNRQKLSDQIASAIQQYNLDGVNVDIENVTETERSLYTDFVKLLRDKLPKTKIVSVAVAANPWGFTRGWHASYDYSALAQYSDYLMVMAYDESYNGSDAGPVASYNFVEATIQKALTEVPKEKLVLGIPFYGRYWRSGATIGGYGLSNIEVTKLISNYNGSVYYDDSKKSPYAIITIKANDVKPSISGSKLEAGTYTIWYENEASIKAKLVLVNKYDLKGTGSWSLGQETKDTWDYYNLWLNGLQLENGHPFKDVQGHWAQNSIISMYEKKWMNGVSAHLFAPNQNLTRAEAAVILVRAMGLKEINTPGASFDDIQGHWAKHDIEIASQHGIVKGVENGKFAPNKLLSRQEMAVMLDRILTQLEDVNPTENPYRDINLQTNSWSYPAIVKLSHYNIFSGNPDGTFGAEAYTTRGQMAALMDRISIYLLPQ